jgi:integrase
MAAYFDKNLERIREIERKVAAGTLTEEKAAKRIQKLREVPDYWVKVYDGPKPIRRHVDPPESEAAAKRLEKKLQGEIASKTYVPDDLLKTTVGAILDAYLVTQKDKGGFAATKSRMKTAEPVRHVKLETWHNHIKAITQHLDQDTPDTWSDKSLWNYAKTLQFAVQRFIDTHQKLNIKNPVRTAIKAMGLEEGTNRRQVVPTEIEYREILAELRKMAAADARLFYLPHLLAFLRETGLREIEALSLRWEKVSLDHQAGKARPWVEVRLRKKKRVVIRRIPLSVDAAKALRALQQAAPGQTETGWVFPVRNFPGKLYRRARAARGHSHINAHDFRREWRLRHLEKGQELRKEVGGHDTDKMDEYYLVLGLEQTREFYEGEWTNFEEAGNAL